MERRVLRFALALLMCASGLWAQTFSVKGVLRDPGGRTVDDGTFKMEFRLYEAEAGGTKVWSEIQAEVPVQHGVFSAELGVVQPLAGVSFLNPLFLGIAVEGHPEMVPRIKILPGPYSMAVLGVDNRFPSTGNVGVNTTSPTEPLEVAGNLKLSNGGVLMFPDGTSLASADMGGTASSAASPGNLLLTADNDATGDGTVQLRTGTTTQVTVTSAGDVGIGTTSPGAVLEVNGPAELDFDENSPNPLEIRNGNEVLFMGADEDDNASYVQAVGDGQYHPLILQSRGGSVGIGTSTPANPLSVAGNADFTGRLGIGTSTPANPLSVTGNADITGRLGIGTSTPANPLSVTGNADITGNLAIGTTTTLGAATPGADLALTGVGSTIELGRGVADKEVSAGQIGFRLHSDALDIVGAGSNQARRLKFWAEQGAIFTGRVGIGTDTPRAPIDVFGYGAVNVNQYGYLNERTPTGIYGAPVTTYPSIITSSVIVAPEFQAISDARVKNAIGTSDGRQDLATLMQLAVTDYTYIDVVAKGTKAHKKLIAQQVREAYSQAVGSDGVDYIPSVYQMSAATALEDGLLRITTEKPHGFAAADTVRLVFDEGYEECVVRQVVDAHTFAVDREQSAERVFVWGKKVHDFLTVDYEAVAMLNLSATQELARQMADLSARAEALAHENEALKAQVAGLAAAEAEKAALEARLTHMEDTVVRVTAALQRLEEKKGAAGGQVLLEVPSATLAQSR